MADKVQRIAESIYSGDVEAVGELVQDLLDGGMAPGEVLSDALLVGMDKVLYACGVCICVPG